MAKAVLSAGYTAREVSKLLGLPPAEVRSWVESGLLDPRRDAEGRPRFLLQDLVLLRTAKALEPRVPQKRLRKALLRLKDQLPVGRPLSAVRITVEGNEIVVRDGRTVWKPESGQTVLDFDVAEIAGRVAPLVRKTARAAERKDVEGTAADWYELACELEATDREGARIAYGRALEQDPRHVDARVNLGRLLHDQGHPSQAEAHYRLALEAKPGHALALFNLGTALEDLHRPADAAQAYERALRADPGHADAHYNLARLYEKVGRKAAAIRHLKAYRTLRDTR